MDTAKVENGLRDSEIYEKSELLWHVPNFRPGYPTLYSRSTLSMADWYTVLERCAGHILTYRARAMPEDTNCSTSGLEPTNDTA